MQKNSCKIDFLKIVYFCLDSKKQNVYNFHFSLPIPKHDVKFQVRGSESLKNHLKVHEKHPKHFRISTNKIYVFFVVFKQKVYNTEQTKGDMEKLISFLESVTTNYSRTTLDLSTFMQERHFLLIKNKQALQNQRKVEKMKVYNSEKTGRAGQKLTSFSDSVTPIYPKTTFKPNITQKKYFFVDLCYLYHLTRLSSPPF